MLSGALHLPQNLPSSQFIECLQDLRLLLSVVETKYRPVVQSMMAPMEYREYILGLGKRPDALLTSVLNDADLEVISKAQVSPIIRHSLIICSSSKQLKYAKSIQGDSYDWADGQAAIRFGMSYRLVTVRI